MRADEKSAVRSNIGMIWNFGSVKRLSLYSAVGNIDAMSIYATGQSISSDSHAVTPY